MNTTASDQQATLLRWLGGDNNEQSILDCRNSINDALKELWGRYEWPYYAGRQALIVNAPYQTGTVTFDLSTLSFTLTGGTWPTWAEYGHIKVGSSFAKVSRRVSATVIIIEEGTQFTASLATAQAYQLWRSEYPLPNNIRKISYLTNDTNSQHVCEYVTPMEFSTRRPGIYGTVPLQFTVRKDPKLGNGLNICLWPFPSTAWTYRYSYIRSPREVAVWSETTGKITTVAADATITGVSTLFDATYASSLLRVGRDGTNTPTGTIGLHPYSEELFIDTVTNTTSLETVSAAAYSRSSVKYEISSLLDIDDVTMTSVFLMECYLALGKRRNKDSKEMQMIAGMHAQAVRDAISKSKTTSQITYAGQGRQSSSSQWYNLGTY